MIKMVDTAVPMNEKGYPVARAKHIWLDDDTNLQKAIDNGLIGGGGDSSATLTQQEYEALSEEQKLDGLYYTYDTKRIYKNGVQYGASDAEGIGYNNAESGIQATTVQGAIDKVVKTVEDNYAKTTDIPTTLPANGGNADTVNNHTVKSDVPENAVFTDTIYDDTELNAKLDGKADKNAVLNSLKIVNGNTIAQIIPWNDGTHYRSFKDGNSNTYTDILLKDGVAKLDRIENNIVTKSEEIATMDKVNNIPLIYNQNTDILAYALTCPQEKRTLVRIHSTNATNNPFGVSTDTDFIYEISKIDSADLWISVKAKDVRTNREFLNTNSNGVWLGWQELATMDKVVKYPDWSNQQPISLTEITVDQDVYIELNQLNSSPIEGLKINGKEVSISDTENGLYSTRFSGYVKKGSVISYPYLTNPNIVRVFPLV